MRIERRSQGEGPRGGGGGGGRGGEGRTGGVGVGGGGVVGWGVGGGFWGVGCSHFLRLRKYVPVGGFVGACLRP